MNTPQPFDEADREDVVAYLDGELDESRSREIERRLAADETARRDVHELQQSFDLLDLLPLAKASEDFTERTLSTIRVEDQNATGGESADPQRRDRLRRGAVLTAWAAGLALSALFGFLATHRWIDSESEELVRDLPVIEKLDAYADAGSVEFLERLRDSDLLGESGDER